MSKFLSSILLKKQKMKAILSSSFVGSFIKLEDMISRGKNIFQVIINIILVITLFGMQNLELGIWIMEE